MIFAERSVASAAEEHEGQQLVGDVGRGHGHGQLSGRSLASTEALAEVWLAMRTTAAVPSG